MSENAAFILSWGLTKRKSENGGRMNFSRGTDFPIVRSTNEGGGSISFVRSMVDTGRFRALRISADLLSKVSSSRRA